MPRAQHRRSLFRFKRKFRRSPSTIVAIRNVRARHGFALRTSTHTRKHLAHAQRASRFACSSAQSPARDSNQSPTHAHARQHKPAPDELLHAQRCHARWPPARCGRSTRSRLGPQEKAGAAQPPARRTKVPLSPDKPQRVALRTQKSCYVPPTPRRSGRAVEGTGFENRRTRKGTVGSNPSSSAASPSGPLA